MKKILGIAMVLGLMCSVTLITGCSKGKEPQAKGEPAIREVAAIPKEKDITEEPTKKEASGKEEVITPTAPKPDPTVVMPAIGNFLVAPFSEAKAKEEQKKVAKSLQKEVEEKEDLGNGIQLEMVLIPAGKFLMGSKKNPVDPFSNIEVEQPPENETPQHEVTLTKSYYMGKFEVTQEQWFEIMGGNPSDNKGRKLPVESVSWNDCQEFIKRLNTKTNGGYRLPTEAEWEYACRAGTSTAYSFGDKITLKDANYAPKLNNSVAVGSYKPNAFGLYDMHGNVREWCADWLGNYRSGAVTDPKGPAEGEVRVLRGGSFNEYEYESVTRSSARDGRSPNSEDYARGFRLAKTK